MLPLEFDAMGLELEPWIFKTLFAEIFVSHLYHLIFFSKACRICVLQNSKTPERQHPGRAVPWPWEGRVLLRHLCRLLQQFAHCATPLCGEQGFLVLTTSSDPPDLPPVWLTIAFLQKPPPSSLFSKEVNVERSG